MPDPEPSAEHELDDDDSAELGEIGAGAQLVLLWCRTHDDWVWPWAPFAELPARCRPR